MSQIDLAALALNGAAVLPRAHAGAFGLEPLTLAAATLAMTAYGMRARTLSLRGRPVPLRRQACFHAGVLLALLALAPPLDDAAAHVFHMHMVQHLLLIDGAALLILAGISGAVLRPLLALPGAARLRALANPLITLPLWALLLCAWHLPPLYEAALRSEALHALEHAFFLAAGMLVWAAVLEPLPGPRWFGDAGRAAYVLAVRTIAAILASVFLWAGRPLYPGYAAGQREWGMAPLTDQAIAGGIMFVEGAVVTLAVFAWVFLRWAGGSGSPEREASPQARAPAYPVWHERGPRLERGERPR